MKATLWLVPVLLAAGMCYWLYDSQRVAEDLRKELEETRNHVRNAGIQKSGIRSANAQSADSSTAKTWSMPVTTGNKVNWRTVSSMLAEMAEGGEGEHMEQMFQSLQNQLNSMNMADMHAALDEIAALGLSAEKQSELEALVVEGLMSKDPEGVLARFDDRIGNDDDEVGWILSEALGHLADKDPVAAARWMDERIKAGKFESKSLDGYSEARVEYESVLMARLLGNGGSQALDRIRALPESDRLVVLEQMDLTALTPEAQSAYTDILRTLVPEEDREGAFGYMAAELVYEGGFQAVQAFLDHVNASPAERAEAAAEAASSRLMAIAEDGKPGLANIEEMRNWLKGQAPDDVDRVTGEAIGEAYDDEGYLNFEEAKKLVLSYHEKSGGDDVLAGFIQSFAGQDKPEEAKKLLNLIRNPDVRTRLLEELDE